MYSSVSVIYKNGQRKGEKERDRESESERKERRPVLEDDKYDVKHDCVSYFCLPRIRTIVSIYIDLLHYIN